MRRTLRGLIPPRPEDVRNAPPIPEFPLPPGLRTDTAAIVHLSFPLKCVTAVVGGGVEKQTPDVVEGLRVPSVRGQLRMWWRAMQPGVTSSRELHARESALWGGGGDDGSSEDGDGDSKRSRVILGVTDVDPGIDRPAGRHEGSDGRYKALPNWDGGRAMGYGLFPLQLSQDDRKRHTMRDPPTANVRHGLAFTLHVTVFVRAAVGGGAGDGQVEAAARDQLKQVLGSVWAWVNLGGIGARTTRGFGALALKTPANFQICVSPLGSKSLAAKALEEHLIALLRCFAPPSSAAGVGEWLKNAYGAFGCISNREARNGDYPGLPHRAWASSTQMRATAQDAHADGLGLLMDFRQAPGVGRRLNRPRPGRSFWPEADTLRRLAQKRLGVRFRNHQPSSQDDNDNRAPRAAFGMPLLMQFKFTDQEDQVANGAIVPKSGDRWTSPLRLRPLRCADGRFVCIMVYLQQSFSTVTAVLDRCKSEHKDEVHVLARGGEGAQRPIATHLQRAGGDAVLAFLDWLAADKGWEVRK